MQAVVSLNPTLACLYPRFGAGVVGGSAAPQGPAPAPASPAEPHHREEMCEGAGNDQPKEAVKLHGSDHAEPTAVIS